MTRDERSAKDEGGAQGGAAAKLARLLETLNPADRQELVAWLLGGIGSGLAMQTYGAPRAFAHAAMGFPPESIELASLRGFATREGNQLVTVRLPEGQHERLRTWCSEHNFAMAAVIRVLIERFLDQQGGAAAAAA